MSTMNRNQKHTQRKIRTIQSDVESLLVANNAERRESAVPRRPRNSANIFTSLKVPTARFQRERECTTLLRVGGT